MQARELGKFKDYKVLYVPYGAMIDESTSEALAAFAKDGGTLLLDEGFAMRQPNIWMNPFELRCKSIASIRMRERRTTSENAVYKGLPMQLCPYKSEYAVEQAETVMCFADGKPAVHKIALGKGWVYLFGFSLGYGYHETAGAAYEELFRDVTEDVVLTKQPYSDFKKGIYTEILETENNEQVLFNVSGEKKTFPVSGTVLACGGDFKVDGDCYCLGSNKMGYIVLQ